MDEFIIYKIYVALKLHFTTDSYNIIKHGMRTNLTVDNYRSNRQVHHGVRKVLKRYPKQENAIEFMVANLVAGDPTAGLFDPDSEDVYTKWKGRIQSITYNFETDLLTMLDEGCTLDIINKTDGFNHPKLFKLYLQKRVSIETMVLLTNFSDYHKLYDEILCNDILWKKTSLLIRKYKPFVKYNKEKIESVYRRFYGPPRKDQKIGEHHQLHAA